MKCLLGNMIPKISLANINSSGTNHEGNIKPMVRLMNSTLFKEYQKQLHKPPMDFQLLENSLRIKPYMFCHNTTSYVNHSREKDKDSLILKWSRNTPRNLNALSTKSTLQSLTLQSNSFRNSQKNSNSIVNGDKTKVPHPKKKMTRLYLKDVNKKKKDSIDINCPKKYLLLKNKFLIDQNDIQSTNEDKEYKNSEDRVRNDPESMVHAMNEYLQKIEHNIVNDICLNENMVKKEKMLKNELRRTDLHVKNIMDSLIRKQRDNDDYLNMKCNLFKKVTVIT